MRQHEDDEKWRRRAWFAVLLLWLAASMVVMRCGALALRIPQQGPPEPTCLDDKRGWPLLETILMLAWKR